ncbi:MAG: penicillin-binding transpeptidase domain-containing protein, partial [Firmicutes bacterium]|nr:penicillin-binding transpeptidase domain-containing protein [Bacillota bacterium]
IHYLATQEHIPYNEIFNGGLKIYTTLNPTVYNIAQAAVDHWMNVNFGSNPHRQAAVMVENPHTGYVLAVIGGRTPTISDGADWAFDATRDSGSSIKPLLEYTPAIAKGYTQMSVIQDVPIFRNVDGQAWWPQNDDHIYRGYMTLRDALGISDNDVAVHLLHDIGVNYGVNFARTKFGIRISPQEVQNRGVGLAIGTPVTVAEMTQAYATFANSGVRMQPIFVTKVVNPYGAVIFQDQPHGQAEFSPQVAYVMDKMLERVLDPHPLPGFGPGGAANLTTGYALGIGRPAGGKTGTDNNETNAWFVGFTPQLVCAVWEGDIRGNVPQPYTLSGAGPAFGATAAGPIWQTIMEQVDSRLNLPVEHFPRPSGMVYVPNVSITSGQLAGPYTPPQDVEGAWFIDGTQPTTFGDTHYPVKVSAAQPDRLWQPGCGPYITSVFLKREPDWHPGVPKPWDSRYWAPTRSCQPGAVPPPPPPNSTGQGGGPGNQTLPQG